MNKSPHQSIDPKILEHLSARIQKAQAERKTPLRIAINGIEATGKTTLAKRLHEFLLEKNLPSIHITIDNFHNPKEQRYRQGRDSARGYYEDAYNEEGFVKSVLKMSQETPHQYISGTHDLETDELLDLEPTSIRPDSILITDGAYLLKPTYASHWDLKIYLTADWEAVMERAIKRGLEDYESAEAVRQKYIDRYHAASRMYVDEVDPESLADVIIDYTDFDNLVILKP